MCTWPKGRSDCRPVLSFIRTHGAKTPAKCFSGCARKQDFSGHITSGGVGLKILGCPAGKTSQAFRRQLKCKCRSEGVPEVNECGGSLRGVTRTTTTKKTLKGVHQLPQCNLLRNLRPRVGTNGSKAEDSADVFILGQEVGPHQADDG